MPRRAPRIDPELKAHQEWLGYLQPRGLVVAPAAMQEAGWVLEQGGRELIEQQEQFREALQPLHPEPDDADDSGEEEPVLGFRQLDALLVEQLNWDAEAMQREPAVLEVWTSVVAGFGDDNKPQLLIQELVPLADGGSGHHGHSRARGC